MTSCNVLNERYPIATLHDARPAHVTRRQARSQRRHPTRTHGRCNHTVLINLPDATGQHAMFTKNPGRWLRYLVALSATIALASCGGSEDEATNASIRVINATADVESIDLTREGLDAANDDDGEQRLFAAVARDSQSDYVSLLEGNWRLRLKRVDASSSLFVSATALAGDESYTVLAYGREGDYRVVSVIDDEDEPTSGKAKVRVFNAAPDAGTLDVYLTESTAALEDTIPTMASASSHSFGFYTTVDRRTYRLRVTAVNDKTDVRLDVEGLELADKARVTIVLQPGPGGVLVNALISQYKGDVSTLKNTFARARLVAGATHNAAVTASLGATNLNVNLRSPSVGSYALVPAGTLNAAISVNATTSLGGSVNLAAGGDYTLAVHGDAAAPTWRLISDDNRPPATNSRVKMRLMHMVYGGDGTLTLVKDYVGVANDVPYGNSSSYSQVTAATAARLEVTSPLSVTPLFLAEDVALPASGVFTVFMLGGGSTTTGILRRER